MSAQTFIRRVEVPVSTAELFAWHERPGAFQRLTPPWAPVEVIEAPVNLKDGAIARLRVKAGGVPVRWTLEHRDYRPGEQFRDVQLKGPFGAYAHTHRVEPAEAGSALVDHIEYALPFGPLGALGGWFVRDRFDQLFAYRHRIMSDDLHAHARQTEPLTIAVTGASGLVGRALCAFLTTGGHTVKRLVRRAPGEGEIQWDPAAGKLDPADLAGVDAVVHLAGESIMGRWSAAKKARIMDSRVDGTRLIAEALAGLPDKPRVLVSASAVGVYGDRGDEALTEESAAGEGFLAEVCRAWEDAARPAADAGIRVVNARLGIVLSAAGGALAQMLLPFKMGVGGPIGSGRQYMSWVALDDAIGAIHHAIVEPSVEGPMNITAPEPVTSRDFARALGGVLRRPAFLPAPAFALKLVMGEAADEMLLAGQKVLPAALQRTGYRFRHADLDETLRLQTGRMKTA